MADDTTPRSSTDERCFKCGLSFPSHTLSLHTDLCSGTFGAQQAEFESLRGQSPLQLKPVGQSPQDLPPYKPRFSNNGPSSGPSTEPRVFNEGPLKSTTTSKPGPSTPSRKRVNWLAHGDPWLIYSSIKYSEREAYLESLGRQDRGRIEAKLSFIEGMDTKSLDSLLRAFKHALTIRFPSHIHRPSIQTESSKEHAHDVKLNFIQFKDSSAYTNPDPSLEGSFPNQKISLSSLLEDKSILNSSEENSIRYFHIPLNNMTWVEVMFR